MNLIKRKLSEKDPFFASLLSGDAKGLQNRCYESFCMFVCSITVVCFSSLKGSFSNSAEISDEFSSLWPLNEKFIFREEKLNRFLFFCKRNLLLLTTRASSAAEGLLRREEERGSVQLRNANIYKVIR